jgi:hypothetical protein
MMHQSIEAGCLASVIEDDPDRTRERLQRYMSDVELVVFHGHVSKLLDMINEEVTRRDGHNRPASLWQSTPVADTGEINVVRGRE